MRTKYKYIHFVEVGDVWGCYNTRNHTTLCWLEYYPMWGQWVMTGAEIEHIFSADCLADIQHFMGQLKGEGNG